MSRSKTLVFEEAPAAAAADPTFLVPQRLGPATHFEYLGSDPGLWLGEPHPKH